MCRLFQLLTGAVIMGCTSVATWTESAMMAMSTSAIPVTVRKDLSRRIRSVWVSSNWSLPLSGVYSYVFSFTLVISIKKKFIVRHLQEGNLILLILDRECNDGDVNQRYTCDCKKGFVAEDSECVGKF